jgi:aminopeptidase
VLFIDYREVTMKKFPPFNLSRLIKTIFNPKKGETLCILIDLENPHDIVDFAFLHHKNNEAQKKGFEVFYTGIRNTTMYELQLAACDLYAYKMTGGSNLILPDTAIDPKGNVVSMENDIYKKYDIILCIGTYSATAPLTETAKKMGFRGATMHGVNDIILTSGLAVDYNELSRETELLRQGMTKADFVDIDFEVDKQSYHLHIDLDKQEAQKSHGLCPQKPDVVNLPAGEVYFVPTNATGNLPVKFEEDGTLALMQVNQGKIDKISLIKGDQKMVDKYQAKFIEDPAAGVLGELGFGTQEYPYANADIQDEKIFGTFHIATGRNDHLNGDVTFDKFKNWKNATHDDILFSSTKTPEILVKSVKMMRNGKQEEIIKNYRPCPYLLNLLVKSS